LLILLIALLIPTPASAMGGYVTLQLIAWSSDGNAALLTRDSRSSGTVGSTHEYLLVTARSATPLVISFDDTQDVETRAQKIDPATCVRSAEALQRALLAARFRGVMVQPARCRDTRAVVSLLPEAGRLVASSWVAKPARREPTPREAAAWDAVKLAQLDPDEAIDVASLAGSLVIVLYGENGDSSPLAHATVLSVTQTGSQILVDDLR
jgi:hypothetical protein